MMRLLCLLLVVASGAAAQVNVDPGRSSVADGWWSLEVELGLSAVVPYRVFTLDDPRRLVLDFEGVDWTGVQPDQLLEAGRATGLRFGPMRPGWSRLVVELAAPLEVTEAQMRVTDAGADLAVVLRQVSAADFAAGTGAPPDPGWDVLGTVDLSALRPTADGIFTVVIDPGHGGIDPGADRSGVREADVMLMLGLEVALALNAMDGVQALLTRDADAFVPLDARMTIARAAGADLFISLHADALEEDEAQGASVYTLSEGGGDAAATRMVERHERGDLLAGVDLSAQGDRVAMVLMDLARDSTGPAGRHFADALVSEMRAAGVHVNSRPRREGQLAVLTSADFASVLIEAGFLSNTRDRALLASRGGRAVLAQAIVAAVASLIE